MARLLLKKFVFLIGVAVLSLCLLGMRLLAGPKNRGARLSNNDRRQRAFNHKITHEEKEWMRNFVLDGDAAHPRRQDPKVVARKLEADQESIPDSEDDRHWGRRRADEAERNDDAIAGEEAELDENLKKAESNDNFQEADENEEAVLNKEANPKKKTKWNGSAWAERDNLNERDEEVNEKKSTALNERTKHKGPQHIPQNAFNSSRGDNRTCSPLKSIAMIKTHKCSSSTLQNILLRKAEDLNLTTAVPRDGVYLGSPSLFHRRFILGDNGLRKYDMMASHMRFRSPHDVKEVMADDAKYVTILRDPAKQYESMYTYYGWKGRFHASMSTFLRHPTRIFAVFEPRMPRTAGRNPMCFDNGLDARHLEPGDERVDHLKNVLSQWYDLVLIAEHFDESLILLKDLMCWTTDDIVYFSQNARNNDSVVPLSQHMKEAIRKWNWADTQLYELFNATLWARIESFGFARMERELEALRLKKEALAKDCIGKVMIQGDKRMWYPKGIKVNSFLLNEDAVHKHLCDQLTRPELTFLKLFRERIYRTIGYPRPRPRPQQDPLVVWKQKRPDPHMVRRRVIGPALKVPR